MKIDFFNKFRKETNVKGKLIVLTASASEMGLYDYSNMKAMFGAFPNALARPFVSKYLKPIENYDKSAKFAPYGLRKVESILIEEFGEENVIVTHPYNLKHFIGKNTKVVVISTMDPLGLAYVSMTYSPLLGFGITLNAAEFLKLMKNKVFKMYKLKKIVGGFGVWQIKESKMQETLGIDVLFFGEAENGFIDVIKKLIKNEKVPKIVKVNKLYDFKKVKKIKNASLFGTIEITRGCGRRCQFCSPDYRVKYDFPLEYILEEIKVNIKAGCDMVFLVTEDIFLYHALPGFIPNRKKLYELFNSIVAIPEIKRIAISHASLAPVIADRKLLPEITPLILEKSYWKYKGKPFVGLDVGIESGSKRIMRKYMAGKALPFSVENWQEIVVEGTGIFNDNSWYPMYTFILGFPEENENDAIANLELLDKLKDFIIFYVPLVFIPLEYAILRKAKKASLKKLNEYHWEFISECWKRNIKLWINHEFLVRTIMSLMYPIYVNLRFGNSSIKGFLRFIGLKNEIPKIKELEEKEAVYQELIQIQRKS